MAPARVGAVSREDPGFLCTPLVTRDEVARSETEQLIEKMFGGSSDTGKPFGIFLRDSLIFQK